MKIVFVLFVVSQKKFFERKNTGKIGVWVLKKKETNFRMLRSG